MKTLSGDKSKKSRMSGVDYSLPGLRKGIIKQISQLFKAPSSCKVPGSKLSTLTHSLTHQVIFLNFRQFHDGNYVARDFYGLN